MYFKYDDRLLKTYQEDLDTVKPIYGITEREGKSINSEDVFYSQFGLLKELFRYIKSSTILKDKILIYASRLETITFYFNTS